LHTQFTHQRAPPSRPQAGRPRVRVHQPRVGADPAAESGGAMEDVAAEGPCALHVPEILTSHFEEKAARCSRRFVSDAQIADRQVPSTYSSERRTFRFSDFRVP
jgi:hypothetical protein